MGKKLNLEAPDVATKEQVKDSLAKGHYIEVVCMEDAYFKNAVWYGEWIVRIFSPDGSREETLVSVREFAKLKSRHKQEIRIHKFKTGYGLMSFLHEVGFTITGIPMEKGLHAKHVLPKHNK